MTQIGKVFRQSMVNRVKDGVQNRTSIFLVSYTKVSGPQMNSLRKGLKQVGANLYVSRNSIAQLALKDLKFEPLAGKVGGQTAFIWSNGDSAEVSKTLTKFMKECQGVMIQGGLLDGAILEKRDVERLADLPSREVLLTMLLRTLNSPMTRLAQVLNGKTRDLLSILKQLSEQKGGK